LRPDGASGETSKDVTRARAEQAPYSIFNFGSNLSAATSLIILSSRRRAYSSLP
jgi:hypothetical protein